MIEDIGNRDYPLITSIGATQSNNVGAIFRNNMTNMSAGSMCHDNPSHPPAAVMMPMVYIMCSITDLGRTTLKMNKNQK